MHRIRLQNNGLRSLQIPFKSIPDCIKYNGPMGNNREQWASQAGRVSPRDQDSACWNSRDPKRGSFWNSDRILWWGVQVLRLTHSSCFVVCFVNWILTIQVYQQFVKYQHTFDCNLSSALPIRPDYDAICCLESDMQFALTGVLNVILL